MKTNIKLLIIILLAGLVTCSGTAFDPTKNSDSAPAAGSISFSDITVSSITVTWTRATDDITPQSALQYKLVKADASSAVDTAAKADAVTGADLLVDWTADVIIDTASGLTFNTAYFFAVLVKDEKDNITLYYPQSVSSANITGILDTTFSTDGKVTTNISSYEENVSKAVVIQLDGKIVTAGYSLDVDAGNSDFAVVRYNADGTLDTTFGGDGIVTTDIGSGTSDEANAVAIDADGKIVVVGISNNDFAVVRYDADGSLDDTGFGGGIVTTDIGTGTSDKANAIAIQSDGKIVVAGVSADDFAVVRYDTSGALDTGFGGGDGIVITAISTTGTKYDIVNAVIIQSDGKIVAAGSAKPDFDEQLALVRYTDVGSLDPDFDGDGGSGNGIVMVSAGWAVSANTMVMQSDGKILTAGTGGMYRFNSSGTLDTSFGYNGNLYLLGITAYALAIQSNGLIVAAGKKDTDFGVVRCNTNGIHDNSFGTNGIATIDVAGDDDTAYAIAIQSDHRIVVAGESGHGPGNNIAVIRLK